MYRTYCIFTYSRLNRVVISDFVSFFVSSITEYLGSFVSVLTKRIEIMNSKNAPKDNNMVIADQTESSTVSVNHQEEPNLEDMELNEEQLDIISGGGGGLIKE
jgi:hypothetical protein